MIEHLSASSISLFLRDQFLFVRKYVLGKRSKLSMNMVIGSAFHKGMEQYLGTGIHDEPGRLLANEYPVEMDDLEMGKWTETSAETALSYMLKTVQDDWQSIGIHEIYALEEEAEQYVDIDTVTTHIPIKGRYDALGHTKHGNTVIDFKTVGRFSSQDHIPISYLIQAHIYMYLANTVHPDLIVEEGTFATAMFIEVKRRAESKRATTPMVNIVTVSYDHRVMTAIGLMMNAIYRMMNGTPLISGNGTINALPNIGDPMSGKESWNAFLEHIDQQERAPIRHKEDTEDEDDLIITL